jgi:hypothetical protein
MKTTYKFLLLAVLVYSVHAAGSDSQKNEISLAVESRSVGATILDLSGQVTKVTVVAGGYTDSRFGNGLFQILGVSVLNLWNDETYFVYYFNDTEKQASPNTTENELIEILRGKLVRLQTGEVRFDRESPWIKDTGEGVIVSYWGAEHIFYPIAKENLQETSTERQARIEPQIQELRDTGIVKAEWGWHYRVLRTSRALVELSPLGADYPMPRDTQDQGYYPETINYYYTNPSYDSLNEATWNQDTGFSPSG